MCCRELARDFKHISILLIYSKESMHRLYTSPDKGGFFCYVGHSADNRDTSAIIYRRGAKS